MYVNAAVIPALCAALMAFSPAPASAAVGGLKSGNERINFSGKLRMLSQRMAAASCNLNAGVDAEANAKIVTNAKIEFTKILGGLRNGGGDLKIDGAETNPAIIGAIDTVVTTFAPIDNAIIELTKNPASTPSIDVIYKQNLDLLNSAKALVGEIVPVYADTGEDGGLGDTINVAGRQRMLTQKMSKEACQIMEGMGETAEDLGGTMQLFEASLSDLSNGENGMVRAPNREIADALEVVQQHWDAIKPILDRARNGEALDVETRAALATKLNVTLRDMNYAVGLYVVARDEVGLVDDIGASERVNFSGKLRMLSQRVAAAACNYNAGIDKDQSLAILLGAKSEFDKITYGLEFGDADLRMKGAEERRKTLFALNAVNEAWGEMSTAIDGLVQGTDMEASLDYIAGNNMELLSHAKLLVSELSGQYSDPTAMLQADAMLVDISGRQRMLTQKMSKEICLIWNGDHANADALKGTMQTFEVSLLALRDGLANAGIKPAPTENIHAGLEDIYGDWLALKPRLEAAVAGGSANEAERAEVFADLNVMLKEMNAVVGLYTIYGKTGI
jgi:hypothetical protein